MPGAAMWGRPLPVQLPPRICRGHLIDLEVADMVAELIGASVLANDGTWVGEVSDVAFDKESDGAGL